MRGEIGSIQIGTQDGFDWSAAGYFAMQIDSPLLGRLDPAATSFNSTIHFVRLDGNPLHKHDVYDFNQTSVTPQGDDTTTFNGTMTVTLRDGPYENVPGYIRVTNDLVSIWLDPRAVDNHFGTTPICDMVLPEQESQIPRE